MLVLPLLGLFSRGNHQLGLRWALFQGSWTPRHRGYGLKPFITILCCSLSNRREIVLFTHILVKTGNQKIGVPIRRGLQVPFPHLWGRPTPQTGRCVCPWTHLLL